MTWNCVRTVSLARQRARIRKDRDDALADLHERLTAAERRAEKLDAENTRLINENNRLWNKLGTKAREP